MTPPAVTDGTGSDRRLACLGNLPPELKALIVLKAVEVDLEAADDDDDNEAADAHGWVDEDDDRDPVESTHPLGRSTKRKRDPSDVGQPARSHTGDDDDGWRDVDELEEENEGPVGEGYGQYQTDMRDALKPTALAALSLVNREFNELATPYLWEELDFEYRSNESALRCIREIVPKHGKHVKMIDFGQSDARMLDLEVEGGYQSADPFAPVPISYRPIIEAAEQLNGVSGDGVSTEIRYRRTRSLLLAEIIRQCPNITSVDTEMMHKTRPEWADDLEDGDLTDSHVVYMTDHALDAVKRYLGPQLEDLSLLVNDDGVSTEGDLADVLLACPNLLRLELDCLAPSGPRANREKLYGALAGLSKLESLTIDAGEFFNDEFATEVDVQWPLKVLGLTECDELSFPAFFTFVHRFSSTLECLDTDRTPHDNNERDTKAYLHRALQLPKLDTLCLATMHEPAWLLDGFAHCPVREFSLGFCPAIELAHIEQFIDLHAQTLRRIEVQGDAALSEAQVESLEVLCHSKHIECEVLPVESDDEDDDPEDGLSDWEDEDADDRDGWTDEEDDEEDDEGDDEEDDEGDDEEDGHPQLEDVD
ncbi:hypothetical protein BMF94_6548 [Rhodotorula taiwanensis]|uniref:Uncharacterized protein n=1 Tax=Rhodotorula taiwanensis TaxID=741276 RepID=A0A2S5B115_9BASI|nr:hypothetical protein BMF94_6548 [Rhodotorula taiwanensis]